MRQVLHPSADGYSAVCPRCACRHGKLSFGPRTLEMSLCGKCHTQIKEPIEPYRRDSSKVAMISNLSRRDREIF